MQHGSTCLLSHHDHAFLNTLMNTAKAYLKKSVPLRTSDTPHNLSTCCCAPFLETPCHPSLLRLIGQAIGHVRVCRTS